MLYAFAAASCQPIQRENAGIRRLQEWLHSVAARRVCVCVARVGSSLYVAWFDADICEQRRVVPSAAYLFTCALMFPAGRRLSFVEFCARVSWPR